MCSHSVGHVRRTSDWPTNRNLAREANLLRVQLNEPMHIGMQSYAAAAHLAAWVYNEQQVRCIFSVSLRSRTNCSTKKCSKKSLCRTISFVKKCGRTARQRGWISTPFPLRKAVFTAGKECGERERAHYRLHTSLFVLLRPFPCVLQH